MTNTQLIPALLTPILIWRFYRRFRRNVGRQTFRLSRTIIFIGVISLVVAYLCFSALHRTDALCGLFGGLISGTVVATIGLRLTKFEYTEDGRFYTPNAYLGVAVSLLLLGRMIYRFMMLYSMAELPRSPGPALAQSPLTLLILGISFGYYIVYSSGLMLRFRNGGLAQPTADDASA